MDIGRINLIGTDDVFRGDEWKNIVGEVETVLGRILNGPPSVRYGLGVLLHPLPEYFRESSDRQRFLIQMLGFSGYKVEVSAQTMYIRKSSK